MAQNISVPDIGDFKDVEVIEVLVKPGDQIKKNDPLVTIESDKSSVEIPSPSEGQIKDLKVKVGDKVSEGSLLVTLESKDSSSIQVKNEQQKVHKEIKKEKPKKNGNVVTTQSLKQIKKVFAEPASKDDIDPLETNEWIESLNSVIENDGASRASYLLNKVIDQAYKAGLVLPDTRTTPYIECNISQITNNYITTGEYSIEEEFGDLIDKGIIDPTKVARTALEKAVSVAGTLLTTECMIVDEPSKDE